MIDHWFWKYAFENKGSYFQAGVATFFVNIFALAVGFFVMVVYDRIIPNNAITSLTGLFFGASVVILLKYFLELLKTYFLDYAGQTIEKKTSGTLFDKILAYDLLRAPKSNGAVASLVKDFETFQQFFTSVTILILIDIPFLFLRASSGAAREPQRRDSDERRRGGGDGRMGGLPKARSALLAARPCVRHPRQACYRRRLFVRR